MTTTFSTDEKDTKLLFPCNPDVMEKLKKFEIRDGDIYLIGSPKSGTTWTQEMVWLIANDMDFKSAETFIDERFPNLEAAAFDITRGNRDALKLECHFNSIEFACNMKSPRYIKIHLQLDQLPEQLLTDEKTIKIIYITRNIKDMCVSSYHYVVNLLQGFDDSLDNYAKLFLNGIMKDHWKTLLYFWNRRHDENILFLRYEELKKDLKGVIEKVSKFLKKEITKDDEAKLVEWLHFESMKNNPAVNHDALYNKSGFIRKGNVGDHKEEMSPETIEKFNLWIKLNLEGSDYINDYD